MQDWSHSRGQLTSWLIREYTRGSIPPEAHKMDLYDPPYVGRAFLYVFCSILGATWQITTYWILGAMSNDLGKLAYFTGLCKSDQNSFYHALLIDREDKSVQSAGAAGAWRADAIKTP